MIHDDYDDNESFDWTGLETGLDWILRGMGYLECHWDPWKCLFPTSMVGNFGKLGLGKLSSQDIKVSADFRFSEKPKMVKTVHRRAVRR